MLSVPVLFPTATGLKVTKIAQLAPAFTMVPQLLVWEKSPLMVILEIVIGLLLVFGTVTIRGLLLVPTL